MNCKRYLIRFLTFLCVLFVSNMVNASGLQTTETLYGPYEVYTKGVGLDTPSGEGTIQMFINGTPVRSYIYWIQRVWGDGTESEKIMINNVEIQGDLIGTDVGGAYCFRSDISQYVTGDTLNTFDIKAVGNATRNTGAGILIVAELEGFSNTEIEIKEGCDFFYHRTPGNENSEVVTFDVVPSDTDRDAILTFFVGDAQTDYEGLRGNEILYLSSDTIPSVDLFTIGNSISLGGDLTPFNGGLVANDGPHWDTFGRNSGIPSGSDTPDLTDDDPDLRGIVPVYAGDRYASFQLLSENTTRKGVSAILTMAALQIEVETPPGTGTPGYWKNHPDAWPVEEISVGGVTYSRCEAIKIMKTSGKGDKCFTMFNALVSAKLNVMIGNESGCISDTVADADSWMAQYCQGFFDDGKRTVKGSSRAWSGGEQMYWVLDDYNNGLLCAPHRD